MAVRSAKGAQVQLDEATVCICAGCGHGVVGDHDCDAQHILNATDPPFDNLGRILFLNARGELIARMAKARQ